MIPGPVTLNSFDNGQQAAIKLAGQGLDQRLHFSTWLSQVLLIQRRT